MYLSRLKERFPDASHHCYAFRIGFKTLQEFANDAGEPGGTAGLPILNRLKSYEILNAGLVVIRYFGGVKLGKPGLIRAYGSCAEGCLQKAEIQSMVEAVEIEIIYPYSESNRIEKLINDYHCKTAMSEYLEKVTLSLHCPSGNFQSFLDEISHYKHLDIEATPGKTIFMPEGK